MPRNASETQLLPYSRKRMQINQVGRKEAERTLISFFHARLIVFQTDTVSDGPTVHQQY